MKDAQIKNVLKGHKAWLLGNGGRPADFTSADLRGRDLSDELLMGACFEKADLSKANLEYSDLTGANLTSANLTSANLRRCALMSATLIRAILNKATLIDADLRSSDLSCTDLTNANLTEAELGGAWLVFSNMTGANLTAASLDMADMTRADLTDAEMSDVFAFGTNFRGVKLGNRRADHCIGLASRVLSKIKKSPECHDQKHWESSCGTRKCVAGWAVALGEGKWLSERIGIESAARVLLGVPYGESAPFGRDDRPIPWLESLALRDRHLARCGYYVDPHRLAKIHEST